MADKGTGELLITRGRKRGHKGGTGTRKKTSREEENVTGDSESFDGGRTVVPTADTHRTLSSSPVR